MCAQGAVGNARDVRTVPIFLAEDGVDGFGDKFGRTGGAVRTVETLSDGFSLKFSDPKELFGPSRTHAAANGLVCGGDGVEEEGELCATLVRDDCSDVLFRQVTLRAPAVAGTYSVRIDNDDEANPAATACDVLVRLECTPPRLRLQPLRLSAPTCTRTA